MRRIVHISDVHFGREDPAVVAGLLRSIADSSPDVIAVSGDLTQRARVSQFRQAQEFLASLPQKPRIVVPGNHDISATNLLQRLARPLSRYRTYITDDLEPFFADDEVALAGVNTTRVMSSKDGRINERQVAASCARFASLDQHIIRIVVTHHPMDLPAADTRSALLGRSEMAMQAFAGCRVDLFLSGHLHHGITLSTGERYNIDGYSAIVAQAGTAVSTRTRGEANSWNLIHVDRALIAIEQMAWNAETRRFDPSPRINYRKLASGWTRTPA